MYTGTTVSSNLLAGQVSVFCQHSFSSLVYVLETRRIAAVYLSPQQVSAFREEREEREERKCSSSILLQPIQCTDFESDDSSIATG